MIGFPKTFTDFSKYKPLFPLKKDWQKLIKKQAEWYLENQNFLLEKKEDWRYFPFQKLLGQNFVFKGGQAAQIIADQKSLLPSSFSLFIQNGKAAKPFTKSKNLLVFSWHDFLNSKINLDFKVQNKILDVLKKKRNAFCSLNNAFFEDGLILIVKGVLEKPLEIHYSHNFNKQKYGMNLRNFIFMEEESSAQIIEFFHKQKDNKSLFLNIQTDCFLSENAKLDRCGLDYMGEKDILINQLFAGLSKKAEMNSLSLSLNAELSSWRSSLEQEEKSSSSIRGLSLLGGRQAADHKTSIRHKEAGGKSKQLFKSFLFDSARHIFQGDVSIEQKAQKSDVSQMSRNFLIGERAFTAALPQLDIIADNVKAVHGAVVSSLQENREMIFYLMARGLDLQNALHLILLGQTKDILSSLNPNIKPFFESLLEKQLKLFKLSAQKALLKELKT